ncbi:MAG TPA: ATP-binding protein, partial [Kofleriaceae bacterium]|nr:ATP-binding protein [Kofleriaceae bacterium]
AGAGLVLRVELPERLPPVIADRDRILQVFDNLVGNAIKFTPPHGEIRIGAAPVLGAVRFWVADSGRGIPAEQVGRLFDRFWRAEQAARGGTGLGLAIVKGVVEAHRGHVRVDSAVGQGSTFSFTLPLAPQPAVQPAALEPSPG